MCIPCRSHRVAVLYFLDYSLNQITIAGFVLSLGLLVDDSIVVVENIARHLRTGMSRAQAALAGTKQIFEAIIGCTATLVFAFLPLAVLPGSPGKFIRVLPVTIMATILGSLFVALLFIPFLASACETETDGHGQSRAAEGDERHPPLTTARPALHAGRAEADRCSQRSAVRSRSSRCGSPCSVAAVPQGGYAQSGSR